MRKRGRVDDMTERVDVAVVGLGAMGAATLYQLARRGVAAIGLDRFTPPHVMGSSHGETRITRCAVGEGAAYVPLVQRSHEIWRALEREAGETLLETCGMLLLGKPGQRTQHHGKTDFLDATMRIAERHGIRHELLDSAAITARFPAFALASGEAGYFEPGGGFLHPERCVATQLRGAVAHGAALRTGEQVLAVEPETEGVRIVCADGAIRADRVVLAAGAWAARLLGPRFTPLLVPYRQVLHWFTPDDASAYGAGAFPTFIWIHGSGAEDYFYGFPALPGTGAVKVASEQYGAPCDPDSVSRDVAPGEAAAMHATHVAGRLRGLRAAPARSAACLYTVTPDSGFVIDTLPEDERVIVISACSGHGFKHSAAIGEAVAQWLCAGRADIDLAPFRLARIDTLPMHSNAL